MIFWGSHGALHKFSATYRVPAPPRVVAGQTVFWWLGVEPTNSADVLQARDPSSQSRPPRPRQLTLLKR